MKTTRFLAGALLGLMSLVGAGCLFDPPAQTDSARLPERGVASPPLGTWARALAAGQADSSMLQVMFLASEEDRRELRRILLNYRSEADILGDAAMFSVVGPGDDVLTPAEEVNSYPIQTGLVSAAGKSVAEGTAWTLYIPLPFFSQRDANWASHALGFARCSGDNIYNYGCHLCTLCMLYARWGYNLTPPALNDWSYGGRTHFAFSSSGCGDLIRLPEALQYPAICRPWRYISVSELWGTIASGKPVVARMHQYGTTHFAPIFGHDGSRYYVKDSVQDAAHQNQPLGDVLDLRLYGG